LLAVKLRRPDDDPHTYGIYRDEQFQGELLTLAKVGDRALD